MVKRIIKKILGHYATEAKLINHEYLQLSDNSVLLSDSFLDFRLEKEPRKYVTIGEKCLIRGTFIFETTQGEIKIGNNVHIGGATFICRSSIVVEDDVTMAWGITIYDHNSHSIYWEERKNDNYNCYNDYFRYNGNNIVNKDWNNVVSKPIIVKSKVWIGLNVVILKGVTIGEGAVVGACSVVTKDVEPWTVVGGNPAVLIKRLK